jgi:hypothetical protein
MKTSYLPSEVRKAWNKLPGAWNNEPDRAEWIDESTQLPCLALRHPSSGHWCGYVAVMPSHPWFGKEYETPDVEVHGGLTFANHCQPAKLGEHRVCHTPRKGEPDNVWWFGFDCAHCGDLSPLMRKFGPPPRWETYKTLSYVRGQCASLAQQLAAHA